MTEATPTPAYSAPAAVPGKTLGIVGLILAFLAAPLGLILSIVAKVQSKGAGAKNTPATVGIVLSILFILGFIIFFVVGGAALFGGLAAACGELGPGVHEVGGVTYTCG